MELGRSGRAMMIMASEPCPCFAIALLAKLTPYLRRRGHRRI